MLRDALAVLGIDAAWTDHEPSGVALLIRRGARWQAVSIAASYEQFCDDNSKVSRCAVSVIDVPRLLSVCNPQLEGAKLTVVAVDMPLSIERINGRRLADRKVSSLFGHCQCAVHSPSAERPGKTGDRLHQGFAREGFSLAATGRKPDLALLEVYPHVALLGLTGRSKRLPYKTGKTTAYWRGVSIEVRKQRLIGEWRFILDFLHQHIDNIDFRLPDPQNCTFQSLKHFEDALDSLICAWVATRYLAGDAVPLGDDRAAIWVPKTSMQFAKDRNAA